MSNLRRAFRFFFDHAGYAVPPGRAVCAVQLARAEARADSLGWTAEWTFDADADLSWMSDSEREQEHEIEGCILRDSEGRVLASLWGIVDADSAYRRVVEAELSLEASEVR
jgi:hypothetical protein